MSDPADMFSDKDEWEEDEDLEGEINLFKNMPWINTNIGSMLEAQLLRYREPNQCRQCGKIGESLRTKETPERFCSDECNKQWHKLMELRIAQGKHDLRTRGYD